ncbi:hypothetical protein LXL04_003481 [Taraxacum kok-saghyz]
MLTPRPYGFVEFYGDEKELVEEFVWCRDDLLKTEMEEIWPIQYSNFSEKMENLMSEMEHISQILLAKRLLIIKDKHSPIGC